MRTRFILPLLTLSLQSHAAIIVASFSTQNYSIGDRPPSIHQTSSIDQTFDLTITSPGASAGYAGYLVFQTQMQVAYNGSLEPSESLRGSGSLRVNDLPALQAFDFAPVQSCTNYWEPSCSIPFTFGVPFLVHVQATVAVDYSYRGIATQHIHGGSSSITITPLVYLSTGVTPAQPLYAGASINSGNALFFTQSPTYRNAVVEEATTIHNPEPASFGLVAIGAVGFALWKKKKPARS